MTHQINYTPVLRWKKAEQEALQELKPDDKSRIIPLLEIPPLKKSKHLANPEHATARQVDNQMLKTVREIDSNWGNMPIYIDFNIFQAHLRALNDTHPIESLWRHFRELDHSKLFDAYNMNPIPVTGLNRNDTYQASVASIVRNHKEGICIRLRCDEILKPTFKGDLTDLLKRFNVDPSNTDLLVDYEVTNESCPSIELISQRIPMIAEWRSYTTIGGAFTKDLSSFKKNSEHELSRADWLKWENQINPERELIRIPNFGDYTIQHAIYYPPPSDQPSYSASIRYTSDKYWVIMRGESVKAEEGNGFKQYPANAYSLKQRSEFCGPDFSAGDAYIYQMANQLENGGIKNTGSAQTWLKAGINHHLTFVVRQIARSFDI